MLKKLLFLTLVFSINYVFAQLSGKCISGSTNINVGQTYNYSVSSSLGQCSNCYDWDVGSGLSISGTDQGNSVAIEALQPGSHQITVTYFNENGCNTCTINVNGIDCPIIDQYEGLLSCSSGSGYIELEDVIQDLSTVASVEWTMTGGANDIIVNNATFDGNLSTQITSFQAPFREDFSLTCMSAQSIQDIAFEAKVIFNNGCPDQIFYPKLTNSGRTINENTKIAVYPNPSFDGFLNINFENKINEEISIKVYDIMNSRILLEKDFGLINNSKELKKISIPQTESKLLELVIYENGVKSETKRIVIK